MENEKVQIVNEYIESKINQCKITIWPDENWKIMLEYHGISLYLIIKSDMSWNLTRDKITYTSENYKHATVNLLIEKELINTLLIEMNNIIKIIFGDIHA